MNLLKFTKNTLLLSTIIVLAAQSLQASKPQEIAQEQEQDLCHIEGWSYEAPGLHKMLYGESTPDEPAPITTTTTAPDAPPAPIVPPAHIAPSLAAQPEIPATAQSLPRSYASTCSTCSRSTSSYSSYSSAASSQSSYSPSSHKTLDSLELSPDTPELAQIEQSRERHEQPEQRYLHELTPDEFYDHMLLTSMEVRPDSPHLEAAQILMARPDRCSSYLRINNQRIKHHMAQLFMEEVTRCNGEIPMALAATCCILGFSNKAAILRALAIPEIFFNNATTHSLHTHTLNASAMPDGMNELQLKFFIKCAQLLYTTVLDISHNNLLAIPQEINNLSGHLMVLRASHNQLLFLPQLTQPFTQLYSIDLSSNLIPVIDGQLLKLPNIQFINLSGNKQIKTPPTSFSLNPHRLCGTNPLEISLGETKYAQETKHGRMIIQSQ